MSIRNRVFSFCVIASAATLTVALLWGERRVAGVIVGLLVGSAIAYALSSQLGQSIADLRDVAVKLAKGDVSIRPPLQAPGEIGEIGDAVRALSEQLVSGRRVLTDEQKLLAAVAASASEGLLAIDDRRQVVWLNDVARRLLSLSQPAPFSLDLLPRIGAIKEALLSALSGAVAETEELQLGPRILAFSAQPLGARGAVLALFDLTHLRRLESMRRDFVANVSHELKTPLTSIRGFAETLIEDELPAELRREFATKLATNASRMERLIDDLLDLSRIESGAWLPSVQTLQTAILVADVIRSVEEKAADKHVRLQSDIGPDVGELTADPTAVRQVLSNLLENALRYTPNGGEVWVKAQRANEGVVLRVSDTGAGIPAEHLPRIFERFYRVDRGRARDSGGTGLGLAIVKHLVEAHGGRVWAESAVGRGTIVSVLFPSRSIDASSGARRAAGVELDHSAVVHSS